MDPGQQRSRKGSRVEKGLLWDCLHTIAQGTSGGCEEKMGLSVLSSQLGYSVNSHLGGGWLFTEEGLFCNKRIRHATRERI